MTICDQCAFELKYTWPEGQQSTHWYGTCDHCGQENAAVCDTRDWGKPKD